MHSKACPLPPNTTTEKPAIRLTVLRAGCELHRFHHWKFESNCFNPHKGKDWTIPEDGARFSPFPSPGDLPPYVPTIYAATTLKAAALESVFHQVPHVPSPEFSSNQLMDWRYSRIRLNRDLSVFNLTNPFLRQLAVPGREPSLNESELIHTGGDQYPITRKWARHLHAAIESLHGLEWRPRLGGHHGLSYVFFGDRCAVDDLSVLSQPIPIDEGEGFDAISQVADEASIKIVDKRSDDACALGQ